MSELTPDERLNNEHGRDPQATTERIIEIQEILDNALGELVHAIASGRAADFVTAAIMRVSALRDWVRSSRGAPGVTGPLAPRDDMAALRAVAEAAQVVLNEDRGTTPLWDSLELALARLAAPNVGPISAPRRRVSDQAQIPGRPLK